MFSVIPVKALSNHLSIPHDEWPWLKYLRLDCPEGQKSRSLLLASAAEAADGDACERDAEDADGQNSEAEDNPVEIAVAHSVAEAQALLLDSLVGVLGLTLHVGLLRKTILGLEIVVDGVHEQVELGQSLAEREFLGRYGFSTALDAESRYNSQHEKLVEDLHYYFIY